MAPEVTRKPGKPTYFTLKTHGKGGNKFVRDKILVVGSGKSTVEIERRHDEKFHCSRVGVERLYGRRVDGSQIWKMDDCN